MSFSKIFCVGFNKTGTTSLKVAIESLGFKVGDQKRAAILASSNWAKRDFGKVIDYCQSADAFQDAPFSFPYTYQAMDMAFPRSKFILTIRNSSEEWYSSLIRFHGKLYASGKVPPNKSDLINANNWLYKGRPWEMNRALFMSPEDEPYKKDVLIKAYENHNYAVQDYFRHRPADLLVLNVSEAQALEKLVRFLGGKSHLTSFPHEKKSK
ncbi:sulfotransferase [Shewanella waksmanii]|uniref:sulfotransferase n=1 Tax=Shewanella waksmanii TaxID=213783 RepID=UPI00373615EB